MVDMMLVVHFLSNKLCDKFGIDDGNSQCKHLIFEESKKNK